MAFTVSVAAQTDVGCVRENNEDRFGYNADLGLYAVCDGMGGMAGGEVASSVAVDSLLSSFAARVNDGAAHISKDVLLFDVVVDANRAVREATLENAALQGMGTTLVAACVDGNRMLIANVGDSRAYLFRDGGCAQLTTDHSFVEEQMRLGYMTREMAADSPIASLITRALGMDDNVEPDLFSLELAEADTILLTTDGLTRYLNAEELAVAVAPQAPLEETCSRLITLAKDRGGIDNITCLLLQFRAA